jgi:hypothetical protein
MANPNPYVVTYSFTGFQSLNPNDPLPAIPLDNEFAAVATAIGELVTATTSIRRADGNLQNGIVTYDALDEDLKALFDGFTAEIVIADLSPTAYASQVEAEAGVANDKLMTPLRSAQAVAAQRPLASQSQAQTGTNNAAVMTPLRTVQALNALRAYASLSEAAAGIDNTKSMTPLRTADAIAAQRTAFTGTAPLTWGSIGAGASATQTITVTGAAVGDRVLIGLPAAGIQAGLLLTPWVSSTNNVTVRVTNITGGALTPHSGAATTYTATALRF